MRLYHKLKKNKNKTCPIYIHNKDGEKNIIILNVKIKAIIHLTALKYYKMKSTIFVFRKKHVFQKS